MYLVLVFSSRTHCEIYNRFLFLRLEPESFLGGQDDILFKLLIYKQIKKLGNAIHERSVGLIKLALRPSWAYLFQKTIKAHDSFITKIN